MTPYELLDLALTNRESSISLLTFGFTMLCAYLLVAYTVGRRLSSFQVAAITLVYVIAYLFNVAAQLISHLEAEQFRAAADRLLLEQKIRLSPGAIYVIAFIRGAILVISLWFMRDVRRRGDGSID